MPSYLFEFASLLFHKVLTERSEGKVQKPNNDVFTQSLWSVALTFFASKSTCFMGIKIKNVELRVNIISYNCESHKNKTDKWIIIYFLVFADLK